MKRRILSVLLVFALLVSNVPAQVFAIDGDTVAPQQTTATQTMQDNPQDDPQDDLQDEPQDDPQGNPQDQPQGESQDDLQDEPQDDLQDEPQDDSQDDPQDEPQDDPKPSLLASGSITYLDADGAEQTYNGSYTELTGPYYYDGKNLTGGWYLVTGTVSYLMTPITVTGDVTLVLADGAELKCYTALELSAGASLTITAQSEDRAGSFEINNIEGWASSVAGGATLTINGGNLEFYGDGYSSGKGNGILCTGDVVINGGSVKAIGNGGAGIGGTGNITINGGSVEAWGNGNSSDQGVAGIDGGNVTITGGTVTAWGDKTDDYFLSMQAIAGNRITISGGVVTANDGSGAIGLFGNCYTGDHGNALIYASSFESYETNASYILFERFYGLYDSIGTVHGNVELDKDLTLDKGTKISVSRGANLTVPNGVTLTVEAEATLENNGAITNNGTIWVKDGGGYTGNGSLDGKITRDISYIDENGETQQVTSPVGLVTGSTSTLTDGWYLAEGTINTAGGLTVTGDVTLVLADGADLAVTGGIQVRDGASLTITAQSKGDEMGGMAVSCPADPGIGIGGEGGNIAVWGGNIRSEAYTIGIGGANSTVVIRDGIVKATSTRTDGAPNYAIGGDGSSVTISGGNVSGISSNYNGIDVGCDQMSTNKPDGSNGNALFCAGSFAMPTSQESLDYILVDRDGSPVRVRGEVTLGNDLTIAADQTLAIPAGAKLTVPEDVTLTNNGTIRVEVGGRYAGKETSPNPVSYASVNYLDENGETRTKRADEVTLVTNSITELNDTDGGWYLVTSDAWANERLIAEGSVTLILADGARFNARQGIEVNAGNSLTITAQSNGERMGELTATATQTSLCAGIGGNGDRFDGSITINGGRVTASAGNGAGIGGIAQNGDTDYSSTGSITINGGVVSATGGQWAPGIGIGGNNGSSVLITINGGDVTAVGGPGNFTGGGAGIGTRENSASGFTIVINGGTIRAKSQNGGAGIGSGAGANADSLPGTIRITGGTVVAEGCAGTYGGGAGAGIGDGQNSKRTSGICVEISGGVVTATGGEGAADIGDGNQATGTSFSTGEGGHAVLYADSITGSDGSDDWNCIWFESETGDGSVCGSVTLDQALTVPQDSTFTIPAGATLVVPEDVTLTSHGSIQVELGGAYSGKQPTGNKIAYWIGWDTDGDGKAETSEYLSYGEMPAYDGAEPVKENTAQYTYTFSGWSPKIAAVNGSRLYIAQFAAKATGTPSDSIAPPAAAEPGALETAEKVEAEKEQLGQVADQEKELAEAADEKPETGPDAADKKPDAAGEYQILSGDGGSWTKGGTDGLTIVANGVPEQLIDLLLDGSSIAPEQYEIREGSTIVTLKPGYLDTLAAGAHTLTFVYENGQVAADFTIAEARVSGISNPMLVGGLAILCIGALTGAFVWKRKEKTD